MDERPDWQKSVGEKDKNESLLNISRLKQNYTQMFDKYRRRTTLFEHIFRVLRQVLYFRVLNLWK